MPKKSIFIIAAQSGGGEKSQKFKPHFWELKKILESNFNEGYSSDLKEMSFIFRVDGEFSQWKLKGCNLLELKKDKGYITIDIGITEDVLDLDDYSIWNFIVKEFYKGLHMMKIEIEKNNLQLDFNHLYKNLEKILPFPEE